MTQMQRSSQQIERALERVKIIQRGAGTLVRPRHFPCAPSGTSLCCGSVSSHSPAHEGCQKLSMRPQDHKS